MGILYFSKYNNQIGGDIMYKNEKTYFGYKVTFWGFVEPDEMNQWYNECELLLKDQEEAFGVVVNMVDMQPLSFLAYKYITDGQLLFLKKGMIRSAVLLNNAILMRQFITIAKESQVYDGERYYDIKKAPDYEQRALNWIISGIDDQN